MKNRYNPKNRQKYMTQWVNRGNMVQREMGVPVLELIRVGRERGGRVPVLELKLSCPSVVRIPIRPSPSPSGLQSARKSYLKNKHKSTKETYLPRLWVPSHWRSCFVLCSQSSKPKNKNVIENEIN